MADRLTWFNVGETVYLQDSDTGRVACLGFIDDEDLFMSADGVPVGAEGDDCERRMERLLREKDSELFSIHFEDEDFGDRDEVWQ